MLKTLKPETFAGTPNAKCGEVYFQSLNSYRIDCSFCEMRSFVFDDFLLHIKNEHLENGLLRTDVFLPKQEKLDSPQSTNYQSENMFSWHEVNNDDYDDDNSEHVFISESKEPLDDNDDNNAVDPVALTGKIMKWNLAEQARRQTRTLKVDYNEESDIENVRSSKAKKIHLPCTQCDKTYLSKKTLARHMERKHNKAAANSTISKVESVNDADADNDEEGVNGDVASKPINEYKCEQCDKVYQNKHTLRQHEKRDHEIVVGLKPAAFACLECNEELPRLRQLDAHMAKVHGGVPCLFCGRRYKTHHELKRHQIKHTSERNVACTHPGCDKRFFTTRHMRSHGKVHLEQKNFVCESCGYSCRNKETLRVHLRSHTGERPFACKVCEKRFPSHSGLREHMAMHSTERPYVCKVCGATFARQKGLYHHKFLHTETKQFVCKLCGNAYAQAAGLAGHMRKHRNDELNR